MSVITPFKTPRQEQLEKLWLDERCLKVDLLQAVCAILEEGLQVAAETQLCHASLLMLGQ